VNVLKSIPSAAEQIEKECESFTWNIEADIEEYMNIKDEHSLPFCPNFSNKSRKT
jgi:hypothetical protein